ncbi:MAG: ATP synthase subunit I [Actinomycetota bacterium]
MDAQPTTAPVAVPEVEREVARDLVRRGLLIAPLVVIGAGLGWGRDGAISAAIGIAIVVANFLVAAAIMSRAARIGGPGAIGGAALGGLIFRMSVIVLALFPLHDVSFIEIGVLGVTLVGAHLGLLAWETKHVSLTLAAPGLRPARPVTPGDR